MNSATKEPGNKEMNKSQTELVGNGFEAKLKSKQKAVKAVAEEKPTKTTSKRAKMVIGEGSQSRTDNKSKEQCTATFQEGDDIVEMGFEGEISSDGEADTKSELSESEGEIVQSNHKQSSQDESERENSDKVGGYQSDMSVSQSQLEAESERSYEGQRRCKRKKKSKRRCEMTDKIDNLTNAVAAMQDMMLKKGFLDQQQEKSTSKMVQSKVVKINDEKNYPKGVGKNDNNFDINSETAVYDNAVEKANSRDRQVSPVDSEVTFNIDVDRKETDKDRVSTSSEDHINTSDELLEPDVNEQFIVECQAEARRIQKEQEQIPEDRGEQIIHNAETSKASLFATPGENIVMNKIFANSSTYSSIVDENYLVIGGHVDPLLQQKIINHEYIDFA